jgi:D-amino-acid dehydrogenase
MPDSVPVVGPAPGHRGLWLATGHGHLGLTDSLNTAQRIANALLGEPTPRTQAGAQLARA